MKKLLFAIILFLTVIINVNALEINSKNYVLYNLDSNEVILEKNKDEIISVASLTKIVTTIVAIENIDNYDDEVVITEEMLRGLDEADAAVVGFRIGQIVTYDDLLYGTIISSGADATRALAISIAGSESNFAKLMNNKVKELGLAHSNFVNSSGLDVEGHYSTVDDIAKLLRYALKNNKFKEIYTTKQYVLSSSQTIQNSIEYMAEFFDKDLSFILGTKTGYTSKAGRCLSSIAYDIDNEVNYLLVTAGAENISDKSYHFADAINIYNYVFNNYHNYIVITKDEVLLQLDTLYSTVDIVDIISNYDVKMYGGPDFDISKVTTEYVGETVIKYGMIKGSGLGRLYVKYDDKIIEVIDIILDETVIFSPYKFIKDKPIVIIGLVCLFLFAIGFVLTKIKKFNT